MAEPNGQTQITNHPHIFTPLFQNNLISGLFPRKPTQNERLRHQEQPHVPTMPANAQSPHQANSDQFDQSPFDHLNFANNRKFPHFFNACLNPEAQSHENGDRMRQIEEMNRSVKQIMRCNQEYRGELLSAYQNKTKVQLENAILIKEKQHLQDQKEVICAELEQSSKRVAILENSIKRLKQNHKHTNDQLKQDILQLQNQLTALRNTKFDLENKSNQNDLFLKTIHNHQLKINKLEQSLFNTANQCSQLKADLSASKEKCNYAEIERNRLMLVNSDQKRTIQDLEGQLKKMRAQNEDLNARYKALNWHYDNIRRQNQYERSRCEKLLHRLEQAEISDSERGRQIQSSQRQFNNLMQAYLSIKSQHQQLQSLPAQLHTARTINQSFSGEIAKRQQEVSSLNYANATLFQQIQQVRSEYARLFCEFQAYKESTSIGAQNCVQGYEHQVNALKFRHQSQIKALSHTLHRTQEENDRLMTVLMRKQEFIKSKEQQISRHLQAILQLQSKADSIKKDKQLKTSTLLSKMSELQAKLQDKQVFIQQLQQAVKQAKTQNLQIVKRQIAAIALKDSLIASLQKELAETSLESDKTIKKIQLQQQQQNKSAVEKQQSLNKQLQRSQQQIITLQNDILTQSQTIDGIKKQLQAKITIVSITTNDNKKLKALCEDLKGQISVIEAQYDIVKNELEQQCKQKHQIAQRLQNEQRKCQKLLRINQKYASQIEQLKTRVHVIDSKRLNAKRQYEQQISQLNQSLGTIRADHVRFRNIVDSLNSIYKQIHLIEQLQRTLTNDPKISIARFSHHITALHRQAFSREVQKMNKYFGTVNNLGEEIRKIVDCLKLSVSAINKGFEVTFSERRINSTSVLCGE